MGERFAHAGVYGVRVVPPLEEVARREGLRFERDPPPEEAAWASGLAAAARDRRRAPPDLVALYASRPNPYETALRLVASCPGQADFGPRSMQYFAVERLRACSPVGARSPDDGAPDAELRAVAFLVAVEQKNSAFVELVVDAYGVRAVRERLLPFVRRLLDERDYRLACRCAIALDLRDELRLDELALPLLLQDRTNLVEEYVAGRRDVALELISYLDALVDGRDVVAELRRFVERTRVPDVKWDKLHRRSLSKLIARLCKKFDAPPEACRNMSRGRAIGGMRFLVRQRYERNAVGVDAWNDLVDDALKTEPRVVAEFVAAVAEYDVAEAAKWAARFGVPFEREPEPRSSGFDDAECWDETGVVRFDDDAPEPRSSRFADSECWDGTGVVRFDDDAPAPRSSRFAEAERWDGTGIVRVDDDAPYCTASSPPPARSVPRYALSIDDSRVVFVDDAPRFERYARELAFERDPIGLDSEWKPNFGAKRSCVSLIQIATRDRVIVLDAIALNAPACSGTWAHLAENVFDNANVVKLGFGIDNDVREIGASIPELSSLKPNGPGYLELGKLWRAVTNAGVAPPFQKTSIGEGLNSIVEQCFGRSLDKDEQCSNWENRPLRKTQLRYAALDAHVLVEIYEYLATLCRRCDVDFDEICYTLVSRSDPPKSRRVRKYPRGGGRVKSCTHRT